MNSRLPIGTQVQWTVPYIENPKDRKRSGIISHYEGRYPIVLLDPEQMKLQACDPQSMVVISEVPDNDSEVYEDTKDEGYD